MSGKETCIVADIGGTNGRFGLATIGDTGTPMVSDIKIYSSTGHDSLGAMLSHYIVELGAKAPKVAKLAIAGPTDGRQGRLTNLGWDVDSAELEREFGLTQVTFLNDFGALARGCVHLAQGMDYVTLKDGKALKGSPISVMGPGTGFGVSLLVPAGDGWTTISTEGGHMAFAPATRLEHDLTEHLREELGYVFVEALLSGQGLARIHRFLVDYGGSGDPSLSPEDITRLAATGGAPSCTRAVQLFLAVLGGVAGDIALVHGARGGIFLGGGILPKIADMVGGSDLLRRFGAKGPMSHYVERIPVHMITAPHAALIGAATA